MNRYVVSREALRHNVLLLREKAAGTPIWAVVKGDGYGLGVVPLAQELHGLGIDRFCVTELREAELLRANGLADVQVLMLRSLSDRQTLARLLELDVLLTVGSWETAVAIDSLAAARGQMARVHVKLDTGMGRYGFFEREFDRILAVFRDLPHLQVCGVYTHFNCAFNNETRTREEFAVLQRVVARLREAGVDPGTVHCCNSPAFLRFPEMYLDGVRLGSALLGRVACVSELQAVGYLVSEVEELRHLSKDDTTGYGALWRAKRDTEVAIVPVGWYHGFRVESRPSQSRARDRLRTVLSALKSLLRRSAVTVEINGKRCPVLGAVGMLHCAVDVTGLSCHCGEQAILQVNPLHVKGVEIVYE